jgi:uncharacterized protein (TIGR02118 family)
MITISILYPNHQGSRFDMRYYVDTHMPLSIELLSSHPGFKGVSVERGLGGAEAGTDATYIALCHFRFNSSEDFMAAFVPHAARLQGDMANYTDIKPVIQFNEVLVSRQARAPHDKDETTRFFRADFLSGLPTGK